MEAFSGYRSPGIEFRGAFREAPRVWNGEVSVYRYRVTVEKIEEPREVVLARMIDLRREAGRYDREALDAEAHLRFGVDLGAMASAGGAVPVGGTR